MPFSFSYKEVLGRPLEQVNALRAKRPTHLRHVPTVQDTRALLQAVKGSGLRTVPGLLGRPVC